MPLISAIAALVVFVWSAVLALRLPLVYGCLALVIVNACFGYAFFSIDLGPTTWTLDRLALPLLVAAFFLQRHLGRTAARPLGTPEWLMLGMVGWLVFSTFTHDYHRLYYHSASPLWRLSTAYGIPAMLYLIAQQSVLDDRRVDTVHAVLIALGVYLAVTGVFEVYRLWGLVYPRFIADPELGIHFGRARGPMLTAVSYGLYLGVAFLALWAARERFGSLSMLAMLVFTPVMAAGLYFSYTRSIWMGTAAGFFIVLAFTLQGRQRIAVLGLLLALGAIGSLTKMDKLLAFQREQDASETRGSAQMRLSFAYVSWQMFLDHPLVGVGFGQFPWEKMPYLSDRSVDLPLEAIRPLVHHNTFLCLLTETGGIGLTLFLLTMAAWVRDSWRTWNDAGVSAAARRQAVLLMATLGLYASQLTFHELSYSTLDNSLIFLLAGMTAGVRPAAAAAPWAVVRRWREESVSLPVALRHSL